MAHLLQLEKALRESLIPSTHTQRAHQQLQAFAPNERLPAHQIVRGFQLLQQLACLLLLLRLAPQ